MDGNLSQSFALAAIDRMDEHTNLYYDGIDWRWQAVGKGGTQLKAEADRDSSRDLSSPPLSSLNLSKEDENMNQGPILNYQF